MSIFQDLGAFLLLGLSVLGGFGYGYLLGYREGFMRGVRAMRRREEARDGQ